MGLTEFYQQRSRDFEAKADRLDKTIQQFAIARLVDALLSIAFFYFGFSETFFFYPIPLLIILFFLLVQKQAKKEEEKILLHLVRLNQWEANASNYDFKDFPDGERFVDPHHPYTHDLDIFGKGSLFQ